VRRALGRKLLKALGFRVPKETSLKTHFLTTNEKLCPAVQYGTSWPIESYKSSVMKRDPPRGRNRRTYVRRLAPNDCFLNNYVSKAFHLVQCISSSLRTPVFGYQVMRRNRYMMVIISSWSSRFLETEKESDRHLLLLAYSSSAILLLLCYYA
jgi:hypothetical protein